MDRMGPQVPGLEFNHQDTKETLRVLPPRSPASTAIWARASPSALLKDDKAHVQAGGGWVNDCAPEAEFQETVPKSKAMLKAVALAVTFVSL